MLVPVSVFASCSYLKLLLHAHHAVMSALVSNFHSFSCFIPWSCFSPRLVLTSLLTSWSYVSPCFPQFQLLFQFPTATFLLACSVSVLLVHISAPVSSQFSASVLLCICSFRVLFPASNFRLTLVLRTSPCFLRLFFLIFFLIFFSVVFSPALIVTCRRCHGNAPQIYQRQRTAPD